MFNIDRRVRIIEALLKKGDDASLTYAALEARLAIEAVCYDRLRFHHKHISHRDLKRWQPIQVIKVLVQELEPWAASSWSISVSKDLPEDSTSKASYEALEWHPLGTQSALPLREIEKLWNALSGTALHVRLPENADDVISPYGNAEQVRRHCERAIALLRQVANGTMLGSAMGPSWSFTCQCGQTITRKEEVLRDGRVISCLNPNCLETYVVRSKDEDFTLERQVLQSTCPECRKEVSLPRRILDELRTDQGRLIKCRHCEQRLVVCWQPGIYKADSSD